MSLSERLKEDTNAALKAGDRERVQALRLVSSELQKAVKEDAGAGSPLRSARSYRNVPRPPSQSTSVP